MKSNRPFCSFLYAGAIILLFSLLTQLTLTRTDTGVFAALWIVVATLFKLIPFLLALAIGIILCVVALLCIYVVAAYIVERTLGQAALARVKIAVRSQILTFLACVAPGKFGASSEPALASAGPCSSSALVGEGFAQLKEERSVACLRSESDGSGLAAGLGNILERLQALDMRIQNMERTLHSVQEKNTGLVQSEQLDAIRSTLQSVEENARQSLDEKTKVIHEHLDKLSAQSAASHVQAQAAEELNARFVALEQRQNDLPKEFAALKEECSAKFLEFSQHFAELRGEVAEQFKSLQGKGKGGGAKKKGSGQ